MDRLRWTFEREEKSFLDAHTQHSFSFLCILLRPSLGCSPTLCPSFIRPAPSFPKLILLLRRERKRPSDAR